MSSFCFRRRPSPATLLALFAVFLAAGGSNAYATVTTFFLGQTDTADAPTVLKNASTYPTSGSQHLLQLTNTSTTTGATALGLTVASGHPPFTVSSGAGKVTNLNADRLDGIDSTGFYLAGQKVADSVHADGADSATTAGNAATVGGYSASQLYPADRTARWGNTIAIGNEFDAYLGHLTMRFSCDSDSHGSAAASMTVSDTGSADGDFNMGWTTGGTPTAGHAGTGVGAGAGWYTIFQASQAGGTGDFVWNMPAETTIGNLEWYVSASACQFEGAMFRVL